MTPSESDKMPPVNTIAMMTPGWPAGAIPNGILASAAITRKELMARGVCVKIITSDVSESARNDPDVIDLKLGRDPHARRRLKARLMYRIAPAYKTYRDVANGMLRGLRIIGLDKVDLMEMEESFGSAALIEKATPFPIVVRLHGPWFINGSVVGNPNDAAFRGRVYYEGKGIAAASAVTAPTHYTLDSTVRHYNLELRRAAVIPNPQEAAPPEHHWDLAQCDRDTILFVGRFDRIKGGDVVIDAFARLAAEYPNLRLVFAGPDQGCRDDDGKMWTLPEYVSSHISDPGIANRLEWLGSQPHDALPALRQKALVTIVSSRSETFGNTATEAMAQGCPIVSSTGGGLVEVIRDGYSGLHCRVGDPINLAERIAELLEDPERAATLGANAMKDCAERFAPAVVADQLLSFYGEVLADRKAR